MRVVQVTFALAIYASLIKDNFTSAINSYFSQSIIETSPITAFIKTVSSSFSYFDTIVCDENVENRDYLDAIQKEIADIHATFKVKTFVNRTNFPRRNKLGFIICESFEHFIRIQDDVATEFGYIALIIPDLLTTQMESIFKRMWSRSLFNINLLVRSKRSCKIFTFMPFTAGKCNDTTPVVINEFINDSWTSNDFFPEKLTNLHNCTFKASALNNAPIVIKTVQSDGSYTVDGSDVRILREIGSALNFQADFICDVTDYGVIFENGTTTGNVARLESKEVDVILSFYYLRKDRSKRLSETQFYEMDPTKIVGYENVKISPIEKLIRPFNFILWMVLLPIMIIGLFSVSVIKKYRSIDSSIQHLNLLVIVLGGSQKLLPKRNSIRILLMFFAMFCIIIRTLYQGSLYKDLQTEERRKDSTSIDELVDQDIVFSVSMANSHYFREAKKR